MIIITMDKMKIMLFANVTDYIGNTSTAETIIVINKVDNAPPTIVSLTSDKPMLNLSNSNNNELVTFTAVVTDNVALSTISFPGTSLNWKYWKHIYIYQNI